MGRTKTSIRQVTKTTASMPPVGQEDMTGCAIASVATLAGVSYKQAKHLATELGIRVTDPGLWSETTFIWQLLRHYGIYTPLKEKPFRSWECLPPIALLAIKWHRRGKRASWHWVVFRKGSDRHVVIDSNAFLKNHHRTDFGRTKPKWIIPIQHASFTESSF